ncbi:unnamed protein product [Protopolystoma xenopodis]|uniref:Uncharacterized protein n=1 Tax=Protopolystoma xenopodis TaxID=117903 RepID=A0A3S5FDN0_9PLAT|nr:unnamed protein product [Protopolystoma xenopodis]
MSRKLATSFGTWSNGFGSVTPGLPFTNASISITTTAQSSTNTNSNANTSINTSAGDGSGTGTDSSDTAADCGTVNSSSSCQQAVGSGGSSFAAKSPHSDLPLNATLGAKTEKPDSIGSSGHMDVRRTGIANSPPSLTAGQRHLASGSHEPPETSTTRPIRPPRCSGSSRVSTSSPIASTGAGPMSVQAGAATTAAAMQLKCSSPGCSCQAFQPQSGLPRHCEICKHSWIFHGKSGCR